MQTIATIGLDIAKSVFQVHGVDAAGQVVVRRREAPLGIVYQTDAVTDQGVDIVGTFPAPSHPPIVYPLAVTAASTNPTAKSYIAFLQSDAVKPALGLQGFALLR